MRIVMIVMRIVMIMIWWASEFAGSCWDTIPGQLGAKAKNVQIDIWVANKNLRSTFCLLTMSHIKSLPLLGFDDDYYYECFDGPWLNFRIFTHVNVLPAMYVYTVHTSGDCEHIWY